MTGRGKQHAAVPHLPEATRVILRQFASRLYEPASLHPYTAAANLGTRIGNTLLFSQLVSANLRSKTLPPNELAEFRTLMTQVNDEIEQYFTLLKLYSESNKPDARAAEEAIYRFIQIYVAFSSALAEDPDEAWDAVRQATHAVNKWLSDRTNHSAVLANVLWIQCLSSRKMQQNPKLNKRAHYHMRAHVAAPGDHGNAQDYRLDFEKAEDVTRFLCATQIPLSEIDVCEEESNGRHHRVTLRDLKRAHQAGR